MTTGGPVEVTTVFELLKRRAREHTPEKTAATTGLNPEVVRTIAREFASAKPAMIYAGYAACKWLHGDLLQRAMLLLLALTGNTGIEGGGLQIANGAKSSGLMGLAFADVGPALRIVSGTTFDYEHGQMRDLNQRIYGAGLADEIDRHYQESIKERWFPSYGKNGWKMGIFAGENGANWRASAKHWRETALEQLETIVTLVPDMGVTARYADYVLPIAHHYERADIMFQSRIPYVQVLDAAVSPLGESVDDWTAMERLAAAISARARARGIRPIFDDVDGRTVRRDFSQYHAKYTMNGTLTGVKDVVQYILDVTPGVPKVSFDELAAKGIIRVDHSERTIWDDEAAPYHDEVATSVREKRPYETLTGHQQFYIDHDWYLRFDEALPGHRDPLRIEGYPLQMMMGHARHGVHTMWRDDPVLLALQRGVPDIYVSRQDAAARGVADGDEIRVFNPAGEFFAQAHVSSAIQPGMVFMYHGWDPMMFEGRQNFSAVIPTAGLIKPTSMAGDYGHLGHRPLNFAPNHTYKDFTVNFERRRRV